MVYIFFLIIKNIDSAQKQLALLTHIQVEKAKDFDYTSPLIEEELKLSFPKDNISNSYSVINQTNTTLPIAKPFQNKIQLLEFHLKDCSLVMKYFIPIKV